MIPNLSAILNKVSFTLYDSRTEISVLQDEHLINISVWFEPDGLSLTVSNVLFLQFGHFEFE